MTNITKQNFEKIQARKRKYDIVSFPQDIDVNGTKNVMLININTISGSSYDPQKTQKVVRGDVPRYREGTSGSLARKMSGGSRRIDTTVALYIPNNIQTSYGADWSASELGAIGAVFDAATGIGDLTTVQGWKQIWEAGKTVLPQAAMNTAAGVVQSLTPLNAEDAKKAYTRTISNPYMEVIFNGVQNRTFSFTFKFIPKDKAEQDQVKKIIDIMKFHRAPEVKYGNVNNYWNFPSEFDITFLNGGVENPYLFKVSTCVMTNMNVEYGGDSHFATHKGGGPFFASMTLEFMEIETLTKPRHREGF